MTKIEDSAAEREHLEKLVARLISERPKIDQLLVGHHIRNAEEEEDIRDIIRTYPVRFEYVGLAGGRQVGKLFYTEEKLQKVFGNKLDKRDIEAIARDLPEVGVYADGRQPLDIPGLSEVAAHMPASNFIYDIDLFFVNNQDSFGAGFETVQGRRSGTNIDVIYMHPSFFIQGQEFFGQSFYNSQQLQY